MKKKLLGLVLVTTCLMLTACTSQDGEAEAGNPEAESSIADASETEIYEDMELSNPWVDADKAEVFEATGFELIAPAEATNVAYSYMPSTGMVQMNYDMENAMWVYRMQPSDAMEDISGIYYEWDYTGETKVAGLDAMEYGYASEPEGDYIDDMECCRVINWYDGKNKVTYSLSVMGKDLNGMDTVAYAEKLFLMPTFTGEVIDIQESHDVIEEVTNGYKEIDFYQSYLGLHVSEYDGSDITVEEGENGRLKVNVALVGLCTLDNGVGIYEKGVVSFDSVDPNGQVIRCCLYYNSDNSLCLKIEESSWEYLPTGTVIEGFDD